MKTGAKISMFLIPAIAGISDSIASLYCIQAKNFIEDRDLEKTVSSFTLRGERVFVI